MNASIALITGGSRGIGAATALQLARRGIDLVINYRDKQARADVVADQVRDCGRQALTVRADLTDAEAVESMIANTMAEYGRLDLLILNASGGLEADMPADYAMRLNRDAQVRLAELAADRMVDGGRIVFVTSHQAHFYTEGSTLPAYAPVAASKQAGERQLLSRAGGFASRGVSFVVVSGDLIDGTITAKLLDRAQPGLIEQRRDQAGYLPTVEDFAVTVSDTALAAEPDKIIFVGEVDREQTG